MSVFQRGNIWWYHFVFAGRHIQESSKSTSKTVAKEAEKKRRRDLEHGINGLSTDNRQQRVRTVAELAGEYLESYRLRNPKSATFAEYALKPIIRFLGDSMVVEVDKTAVTDYQTERLKEGAAAKSVNEEIGFLLRILGDDGEILRGQLRKARTLKLKVTSKPGKAFSGDQKSALEQAANRSRSHRFRFALTLASNTGLRSAEFRTLQWNRFDLDRAFLTVGESKTEGSTGRTVPLNSSVLASAREYATWYESRFGARKPEWYVFPFGKPHPTDPTQPVTTFKTAWRNAKKRADMHGRIHDLRHTVITELAENGAGDQTIMDIVGHVSKQMLKHYSHIRMEAKRKALEGLTRFVTVAAKTESR
jgi:integrase